VTGLLSTLIYLFESGNLDGRVLFALLGYEETMVSCIVMAKSL